MNQNVDPTSGLEMAPMWPPSPATCRAALQVLGLGCPTLTLPYPTLPVASFTTKTLTDTSYSVH